MNEHNIIESVKYWIEKTIIGFNFCPFAKQEFESGRIHYEVVDESSTQEQLLALINEFHRLDEHTDIETTIVIYPMGLEDYFAYLDFLEIANDLLIKEGYEGIYQLASFHPDYCFADVTQNDPSNYTNRSPYPALHIIREESLERALAKYPNPQSIPKNNIELTRKLGARPFATILTRSKNHGDH